MSLKPSILINHDMIFWCTQYPSLIWWCSFHVHGKSISLYGFSVTLVPSSHLYSHYYIANTLQTVLSKHDLHSDLTYQLPNLVYIFLWLSHSRCSKSGTQCNICFMLAVLRWEVVNPFQIPKMEYHALSAVCNCLFIVFLWTSYILKCLLHPQPWGHALRGELCGKFCMLKYENIKLKYVAFILNGVYEFVVCQNLW